MTLELCHGGVGVLCAWLVGAGSREDAGWGFPWSVPSPPRTHVAIPRTSQAVWGTTWSKEITEKESAGWGGFSGPGSAGRLWISWLRWIFPIETSYERAVHWRVTTRRDVRAGQKCILFTSTNVSMLSLLLPGLSWEEWDRQGPLPPGSQNLTGPESSTSRRKGFQVFLCLQSMPLLRSCSQECFYWDVGDA